MYSDRLEKLGKVADHLYNCERLKNFKDIIGGLCNNEFKRFVMNKSLSDLAKGRKEAILV